MEILFGGSNGMPRWLPLCAHFLGQTAVRGPKRGVRKQLTLAYMSVTAQCAPLWEGASELPDSLLSDSFPCPKSAWPEQFPWGK